MEAFSPAAWYEAPDGRWVAVIEPAPGYDPTPLVGQPVTLGGSRYVVTEIVAPAVDNPSARTFGLVVEAVG